MSPRDHLRQLVEELPDSEVETAERVLSALAAVGDPVRRRLDSALPDDESESDEERAAVTEAWTEHRSGKGLSTGEVRRELGLDGSLSGPIGSRLPFVI